MCIYYIAIRVMEVIMTGVVLWLVVPCYNEEEVLPETSARLKAVINGMIESKKILPESRIAFVNDGSRDGTWNIIKRLHEEDDLYVGVNLARNRGHQNALVAGLMTAGKYADAVISLDADLQDDIGVIEKMVDEYIAGNDIVYGVRSSREKDTFFKRVTAETYYKILKVLGVDIVFNHADYRLMSKRALEGMEEFGEVNLFLRGIVPQIGYPSSIVEYERHERFAGESKYPLKKMIAFAIEGITSFSVKPLRIGVTLGFMSLLVCIVMIIYCIVQKCLGNTIDGWASLGVSIWGVGALQLFMLGIIGEYLGKVYMETKHRPRYIIESVLYKD